MLLNARSIHALAGQPNLILLAIEDITLRKQAEHELKVLNQTLEDRVSSRTAEAESRAEALRDPSANSMSKSEFSRPSCDPPVTA